MGKRALIGLLIVAVWLLAAACTSFAPARDLQVIDSTGANGTVVRSDFSEATGLNYILTHPSPGGEPLPLIVFLHSLEERGDRLAPVLENPAGQGLGLSRIASSVAEDHPLTRFATLSPLCPAGTYWHMVRGRLFALIDEIAHRRDVNTDQVIVTGVSMGGMGAWSLGMAEPQRFTAIVPIAGGVYSPPMRARFDRLVDTPMWVVHDRLDPSIELERDAWAVERVREAGGSVRFTITNEARHYVHEEFYHGHALYEWLLALP